MVMSLKRFNRTFLSDSKPKKFIEVFSGGGTGKDICKKS